MRVVLRIDAEPDGFLFDPAKPPSWTSFETAFDVMQESRARLEAATGQWPTFAWGLRVDPQIAAAYGSLDWALRQYADRLDALQAAGDDLGLHTHYYRLLPNGKWVIEFLDAAWIRATLDDSHGAFVGARGRPPAFFGAGNKMIDSVTLAQVARLGIPYDASVEPGLYVRARSWYHAGDCDFRAAPREPYVPDPTDFCRPAPPGAKGPVVVPAATGRPRWGDAPLLKSLALRARVCQQQRLLPWKAPWSTLYLSQRPWQFNAILADILRRGVADVLHVCMRNCLRPDWTKVNLARLAALPGARFQGFTGIQPAAAVDHASRRTIAASAR